MRKNNILIFVFVLLSFFVVEALIQAFIYLKKKIYAWLDHRLDELRAYDERNNDKYSKKSFKDITLQVQKEYLTFNVNKKIGKRDNAVFFWLAIGLCISALFLVYRHNYLKLSIGFSCYYAFLLFVVALLSISMFFLVKNVGNKYKDAGPRDSINGKDMRFEGDRPSLFCFLLPSCFISAFFFIFAISHMELIFPVIPILFSSVLFICPLVGCALAFVCNCIASRLDIFTQFKVEEEVTALWVFLLFFIFAELVNKRILKWYFEKTEKGLSDIEKQKMYNRYEAQYSVFRIWMLIIVSIFIFVFFYQSGNVYSGAAVALSLLALKETLVDRNKEEERTESERNSRGERRRRRKRGCGIRCDRVRRWSRRRPRIVKKRQQSKGCGACKR